VLVATYTPATYRSSACWSRFTRRVLGLAVAWARDPLTIPQWGVTNWGRSVWRGPAPPIRPTLVMLSGEKPPADRKIKEKKKPLLAVAPGHAVRRATTGSRVSAALSSSGACAARPPGVAAPHPTSAIRQSGAVNLV
jgi:hypothetical protein